MRRLSMILLATLTVHAAAQEPVVPVPELKAIAWMAGTWTGSGAMPDGAKYTDKIVFAWTLGGRFLKGDYEMTAGGAVAFTDVSYWGWDPARKRVFSTSFASDGSFSTAEIVDSKTETWVLDIRKTSASGVEQVRGTITRIDPDSMSFVAEQSKDGTWRKTAEFKYSRAKELDRSSPKATAEAWIAAVQRGSKNDAFALMTADCRKREDEFSRSFSKAFFEKHYKLEVLELREPTIEGEKASVSIRARLIDQAGQPDPEGIGLQMQLKDGKWWIAEIN